MFNFIKVVVIGIVIYLIFIFYIKKDISTESFDINKPNDFSNIDIDPFVMKNFNQIYNTIEYLDRSGQLDRSVINLDKFKHLKSISFDNNDQLEYDVLGESNTSYTNDNKYTSYIVLNPYIKTKSADMITIILLHEIGHGVFRFEHYDDADDIMNECNNISDDLLKTDIKYIIIDFCKNSRKYSKF